MRSVQWQRSTERKPETAHDVERVSSDDSSDDLATERDPLWRKQLKRQSFERPQPFTECKVVTKTSKSKCEEAALSSDTSSLGPPRSVALKRKDAFKFRNKAKRKESDRQRKAESCSSCDDLCMHSTHKDIKPQRLLERYSKRSLPSTSPRGISPGTRIPTQKSQSNFERGISNERFNSKMSKEATVHPSKDREWRHQSHAYHPIPERRREWQEHLERSLTTAAKTIKDHINYRLERTDDRLEKVYSILEKRKEADGNVGVVVDELKTFIGGQLRKGMEKAVASAVIKLNERMRSEAENANEKMELLMKGLMESYALISRKVEDLTDVCANKGVEQPTARRVYSASPRRSSSTKRHQRVLSEDNRRKLDDDRDQAQSDCRQESRSRHSERAGSFVDRRKLSGTASDDAMEGVNEAEYRRASSQEVSNLRQAVDELEEKTKQCWFEIVDVRDTQLRRHRRTRQQLKTLTQECTQNRSTTESKDAFVREQIATISQQLKAIEDSIAIVEKSRARSDCKSSEIEAYVTQIYDACKATLKNVDVRYQKLKQCYREVKGDQVSAEGKCDALAESLSNLYREVNRGKDRSRSRKAA